MGRLAFCIILSGLTSMVLANSAVQTDWSDGPGVPGPVADWGASFDSAFNLQVSDIPGLLSLDACTGMHYISDDTDTPVALLLADLDGDGSDDAAACCDSGIIWWRNADGCGSLWEPALISPAASSEASISAADLDQDGDQDLIVSIYTDRLSWWENAGSGTSWLEHVIMSGDVRECRCADFDGDGQTDVALMVPGTSDVMWWRNRLQTGQSWSPDYIDGAFPGASTCDAADFDGNGTMDLAAASYSTGEVAVYLNQPSLGSWEKYIVYANFQHPSRVRAADINGDGLMDLTGVCWTNNYLVWWEDPGTYPWTMHTLTTDMTQASAVCPADMDGDGDMDILATAFDLMDGLRWYDNLDGTGLSWELVEAFNCFQARDVAVGDVNGDGILEIAAPSACTGRVRYWRIGGYETPGELVSSVLDTGTLTGISWDYLHWDATVPSEASLRVAVRGSSSADDMGPWSDWLQAATPLSGLLDPDDRYIQYKVELTTADPWLTPSLSDITFLWSLTGVETGSESTEPLRLAGANPARGSFQLDINLPVSGYADLAVFDLSGRRVASPVSGTLEAGAHSVLVSGLPSGIYVCVYSAPETSASLRVTVVR